MYRGWLLVWLSLACGSDDSLADWTIITSNDMGIYYIDPDVLRINGSTAELWALLDLTRTDSIAGKDYLSVKSNIQFNCQDEQVRVPFQVFYGSGMGAGAAVHVTEEKTAWHPVAKDSVLDIMWKFACK